MQLQPAPLRFLCVIAVLLAFLGGCASVPMRPGAPVQLPVDLADLDRWQARGRLGVSGIERGGSGSFDWQQRGQRADISIRGPVGLGSVRLQLSGSADAPQLKLETGNGQVLKSLAAWQELEARLGASVPAGKLRYWMLGLAAPGEHTWQQDEHGGVTTLEQDDWRIDYQRYSSEPGARVPVRLRASNGQTHIRIIVDRWRLGQ